MFANQRHKWNHEQCSYCGKTNVQFVCWECLQSETDSLRKEIELLRFKYNELIDALCATNRVDKSFLFYKIKDEF